MGSLSVFNAPPIDSLVVTVSPSAAWTSGALLDGNRNSQALVTSLGGSTLSYSFIGSGTSIVGSANPQAVVIVSVDGNAQNINAGVGSTVGFHPRTLFSVGSLDGTARHNVELTFQNSQPPLYISNITWDFTSVATLTAPSDGETLSTIIPATGPINFQPQGAWLSGSSWEGFQGDASAAGSVNPGASFTYNFFGTATSILGDSQNQQFINVVVDGQQGVADVQQQDTPGLGIRPLVTLSGLSLTNHTIQVTSNGALFVENVQFVGPASSSAAAAIPTANPTAPFVVSGLGSPTETGQASFTIVEGGPIPTAPNPAASVAVTTATSGPSTGGIVGAVIGGMFGIMIVVLGVWFFRRRSRRRMSFDDFVEVRSSGRYPSAVDVTTPRPPLGRAGSVKRQNAQSLASSYPATWDEKLDNVADAARSYLAEMDENPFRSERQLERSGSYKRDLERSGSYRQQQPQQQSTKSRSKSKSRSKRNKKDTSRTVNFDYQGESDSSIETSAPGPTPGRPYAGIPD